MSALHIILWRGMREDDLRYAMPDVRDISSHVLNEIASIELRGDRAIKRIEVGADDYKYLRVNGTIQRVGDKMLLGGYPVGVCK